MPRPRTSGVCSTPGCPADTEPGKGKCPAHQPAPWTGGSSRRERLPNDWPERRRRVLERDGHRCYRCGAHADEVDHVEPGDDHRIENLAAICTTCHRRKSASEGGRARAARAMQRRA